MASDMSISTLKTDEPGLYEIVNRADEHAPDAMSTSESNSRRAASGPHPGPRRTSLTVVRTIPNLVV